MEKILFDFNFCNYNHRLVYDYNMTNFLYKNTFIFYSGYKVLAPEPILVNNGRRQPLVYSAGAVAGSGDTAMVEPARMSMHSLFQNY